MRRLLVPILLLVACSSPPASTQSEPAAEVRLGLTEFAIASSSQMLADGDVTLQVTNAGTTAHDLRITGATVDEHVPLLGPGESTSLLLDVTGEQELRLWCTVAGHRSQGMQRTLEVGV